MPYVLRRENTELKGVTEEAKSEAKTLRAKGGP